MINLQRVGAYYMAEDGGVEPHPFSENLVFKASRRTIPAASSSLIEIHYTHKVFVVFSIYTFEDVL